MADDQTTYDFDDYKYYESSDKAEIKQGLRAGESVQSCQYWLKGLSARCTNWDESTRTCKYDITKGVKPSGYNFSKCDYLGRRFECDKYEAGEEEDLTKYWCILPNMFLTGVAKRQRDKDGNLTSDVTLSPVPTTEVKGYCEGRCDEQGRGTGCGGVPDTSPVICNYYRPWQMSFGPEEPRPLEITYRDGKRIITPQAIERAYELVSEPMGLRLPFSFKLYNNRAAYQKCLYWDDNYGAKFEVDSNNGVQVYDVSGVAVNPSEKCTSQNTNARSYSEKNAASDDWLLKNVWCDANTVICNGAKPECPCYTGKWAYCTDEKMLDGMRITANQIFELRFWARNWTSQDEYDTYFKKRPNFLDVSTSDIYTFTKWQRLDPQDPSKSIMEGKKIKLCVPSPVNKRDFNAETHLLPEDLTYTAINIDAGTTAPNYEQIYYPSLVRDIQVFDYKPLDVMYPYATNDPWSAETCAPLETLKPCVKRGVSLEGDRISSVGYTVRNCSVYLINLSKISRPSSEQYAFVYDMLKDNLNITGISDEYPKVSTRDVQSNYTGLSDRAKFFVEVGNLMLHFEKYEYDAIAESTSDSQGYFKMGPVDLKYNSLNKIVVLVKYPDSEWDFRHIPVWSQIYGGAIIQTSFDAGDTDYLPNRFGNSTIEGKMVALNCNSQYDTSITLDSLVPIVSHQYQTMFSVVEEYSYCIKKVTVSDEVIRNWGKIGNTSRVWVELEDLNINHLLEWGITSAKMVNIAKEESEDAGESEAGGCDDESSSVELKQKTLETWESGKLSFPASACVLEPKDDKPRGFFNNDYRLEITYWYKTFSNTDTVGEGEEILWPDFSGIARFVEPSIEITSDENVFHIGKVRNESVALMAFFKDEEGRLVSCMATKLLVWVPTMACRNVEIDYRYQQPTNWYILQPETSTVRLATPPTSEELQGEYSPRFNRPPCGDHKNGPQGLGKGAMWFPFTTCDDSDFYRAYAGGSFCTNYFQDTPRDDMRFCATIKYTAWVAGGGAGSYADCVLQYHYRYSVTTGQAAFAGYANIVAYVNALEYKGHHWALPPFGNKGREMVEKWLSKDYWPHLSAKDTVIPVIKKEWVPIVPDKEDFFLSFNAFEESSENSTDNFSFTSQLHFMLSDLAQEKVDVSGGESSRKRFEDVFGLRGIWSASYPYPLIPFGPAYKIAHYYFKESDTAWAWREFWKDIEYVSDRTLFFVSYDQPDYKYSYEKEEHRYICEEQGYKITYTKPTVGEGSLIKFPGIKLGSGHVRYFEIRYDEYDDSYVEWKDENDGMVDGSDGEDESSLYEKTSPTAGVQWDHDVNILFDGEAVDNIAAATAAGREFEILNDMEEVIKSYYNRGLIALIKTGNLKHLPYSEEEGPSGFDKHDTDKADEAIQEGAIPGMGWPADINVVWKNVSPTLTIIPPDVSEGGDSGLCISKILIKSKWGHHKPNRGDFDPDTVSSIMDMDLDNKSYNAWHGYEVCKPGITITTESEAGSTIVYSCEPVAYNKILHGSMGLVDYVFDIPIQPTVNRMFYKPDTSIKIKFNCAEGQFIVFNDDSYECYYASYTNTEETIYVYERKYFTSVGNNFGDYPLNGPQVDGSFPLQYELGLDNSGVYFPAHPQFEYVNDDPVVARDKLRSVYASEQYREDESLDINIENISTIEQEEQKELYNDALKRDIDGDTLTYSIITPPHIRQYLEDNALGLLPDANGTVSFKAKLDTWEDLTLVSQYKEGHGVWYPQGHKYVWSDQVKRMFCYENDYMPQYAPSGYGRFTIVDVKFLHMDTLSAETPSDPLTALYANRMIYQLEVAIKTFGNDAGFTEAGRIMGTASSFLDNSNVGDSKETGVIAYD